MTYERKYLTACAAVAAGEALAIAAAGYCELWPLTAAIAVLTALFGFGYALPGWKICTIAVASLTVAFAASCGGHQLFREKFWMKDGVHLPPRINRSSSSADILRAELSRRAGIGLEHSPGAAALNRAILLGERRRLSRSTRQTFIDAGTMHIFAISGLHVMVIALTLRALAKMFFIPLRLAGALSLPVLWLYVFIVGIPPSAVRAAIMASIHFSSALFLRRPNAVVSWSLTFLIVHLHSPALIRDAVYAGYAVGFGGKAHRIRRRYHIRHNRFGSRLDRRHPNLRPFFRPHNPRRPSGESVPDADGFGKCGVRRSRNAREFSQRMVVTPHQQHIGDDRRRDGGPFDGGSIASLRKLGNRELDNCRLSVVLHLRRSAHLRRPPDEIAADLVEPVPRSRRIGTLVFLPAADKQPASQRNSEHIKRSCHSERQPEVRDKKYNQKQQSGEERRHMTARYANGLE